jgi:hypothetical protein
VLSGTVAAGSPAADAATMRNLEVILALVPLNLFRHPRSGLASRLTTVIGPSSRDAPASCASRARRKQAINRVQGRDQRF